MERLVEFGKQLDKQIHSTNVDEKITSSYIHFLLGQTTKMLNQDKTLNIDKYFEGHVSKIKCSLAETNWKLVKLL
ncbi:MAG: hypothetical protein IPG53_09090 [Ignavibacteriales bacterium]|nr:hypothetical protein [Ignavibacteriales bacterium]